MSTTFYIRYDDTQHDEQQPEGSKKQRKAAQRADLLHNNRSAANLLAQTIGTASSSTQEAQVESTVSPAPCMSDGANQKAPQASQLRLARRRPEFFGQAHERRDLVQLPCSPRSDVAHAALNSATAKALVAHELVKELAFHKLLASDFWGLSKPSRKCAIRRAREPELAEGPVKARVDEEVAMLLQQCADARQRLRIKSKAKVC